MTTQEPTRPSCRGAHLGLTVLLGLVVAGFLGLAFAGQVHFGKGTPAREKDEPQAPAPTSTASPSDPPARGEETPSGGGRYHLSPVEAAGQAYTEAGRLGFLGERVREVHVFKYRGGYLEAWLELGAGGVPMKLGPVPRDKKAVLANDKALAEGTPGADNKEGLLILAAIDNAVPPEVALSPYFPHLGGFFAGGPGGPLAMLPILGVEAWHPVEYRLFISAGPPRGKAGSGFRQWTNGGFGLRFPFGPLPAPAAPRLTDSTDAKPGEELILAAWQWGDNSVHLKARFLTEEDLKDPPAK